MSSSALMPWVWRTLKKNGGAMSLPDMEMVFLVEHEGAEEEGRMDELIMALDDMIDAGHIEMTMREGWTYLSIRFFLDPAFDPEEIPAARFYEYEKILETTRGNLEGVGLEGGEILVPDAYDSPLLPYLPLLNQGGVPDCVGHAGALAAQANYLAVTEDIPDPREITRDLVDKETGMIYDRLYRTCFSPWWIYCLTRKEGHILGQGSRTELIPKVLKSTGAVPWDDALTPKTTDRAPELKEGDFEALAWTAAGHKIQSFAKIATWVGLLHAIATHQGRGVVMPINLWEDYTSPLGDGTLRYSPEKPVAGAHSLFWHSYRDGKVISLNSWGDFLSDLKITRDYWERMAGAAFVFLDDEETRIAQALYVLTTIATFLKRRDGSVVPLVCQRITVDGDVYKNVDQVQVMLEKGRTYSIEAQAQATAKVSTRTVSVKWIVPDDTTTIQPPYDKTVTLVFEEKTDPFKDFWDRIRGRLKNS